MKSLKNKSNEEETLKIYIDTQLTFRSNFIVEIRLIYILVQLIVTGIFGLFLAFVS